MSLSGDTALFIPMTKIERGLRDRIKDLEARNQELIQDRTRFRDHFSRRFRWWIALLGSQKTPSLAYLIEDDAKVLRGCEWWSW